MLQFRCKEALQDITTHTNRLVLYALARGRPPGLRWVMMKARAGYKHDATCKTDMQKHQHKNIRKVKKPCKCCFISRDRWVDSNTNQLALKMALFMQTNTWGLPCKLPTSNARKREPYVSSELFGKGPQQKSRTCLRPRKPQRNSFLSSHAMAMDRSNRKPRQNELSALLTLTL